MLEVQLEIAATCHAARIARLARESLEAEVRCWPKPGLVSHVDSGSHRDMDAALLLASAAAIEPFFAELVQAGRVGAGMDELRAIGRDAERAMLAATGGVNTHRGAVFGLGLLCAAAAGFSLPLAGRGRGRGARRASQFPEKSTTTPTPSPAPQGGGDAQDPMRGESLGTIVRERWGAAILAASPTSGSHGADVLRRHGAAGARGEAAAGFPAIYAIGLPALRRGASLAPGDAEAARIEAIFALVAGVVDTNLLHRGGAEGLAFAQHAARTFRRRGGVGAPDWRRAAAAIHDAFVARNLSPGGAADLLAMTLFVAALEGAP